MTTPAIDDLDRELIALLSKDARVSNRKIAADLNVTEGTVRGRIKRLQAERLIAFTAITSFALGNTAKLAFVGVRADVETVRAIAHEIATLPLVTGVMITMGRFDIVAFCLFETLDDLLKVASDQILALPGVHHVETSIAVKTIKYNARIVRITEADHATEITAAD